jgi:hypothetical protein
MHKTQILFHEHEMHAKLLLYMILWVKSELSEGRADGEFFKLFLNLFRCCSMSLKLRGKFLMFKLRRNLGFCDFVGIFACFCLSTEFSACCLVFFHGILELKETEADRYEAQKCFR